MRTSCKQCKTKSQHTDRYLRLFCGNPKEYNLEIATKTTKVFGFVGTDHLRTKIINDETPEQVSQFTYLGCSIYYQFSNDAEFKLAKFLQLIGTIKRTIFRKVWTETIYNTLVMPTFLYGSENWTLDSPTGKKNWSGRNEVNETSSRLHPLWPQNKRLRTPWTTDWMHTGQDRWIQTELAFTLAKNYTEPNIFEIIAHKEGEQLEDWRNVGESSCNSGDGTDQRVQSLMFMMMMYLFYFK